MNFVLVGIGGALGSMLRYGMNLMFARCGAVFPYSVFVCNVLGTILLAFVAVRLSAYVPENLRLMLSVGFCGGLTTFSTFSLDAVRLLQLGDYLAFGLYVFGTVLVSFAAMYFIIKI